MNKSLELREKRAKLWDAAKAFLDDHRAESGLISTEDATTYERMETDVINMGKEVERLDRQAALDREMSTMTTAPILGKPESHIKPKTGKASDEYMNAFWGQMRNRITPELRNALREGSDADGGFLVPDEFERRLIESLAEENIMRKLCNIIVTSSGDRKIPVVASKGTATWTDEEGLIPDSDDTFGQVTLGAHKVATMIKISEELIQDAYFNIENYIATEFARRIGAAEEESFIVGNGMAKPTGILHDTFGAEVGTTTASSTVITMDDVLDLMHSLRGPYRKNALFLTNDATVKMMRKLKDSSGQYVWSPSVQVNEPDTIFGKKVYTTTFMPDAAAGAKALVYGDLKHYWIADRQGRSFQRLSELFAATAQIGYRGTQRVDGRLVLPEAVKCLKMKV